MAKIKGQYHHVCALCGVEYAGNPDDDAKCRKCGSTSPTLTEILCSGPACSRPAVAEGLCATHYRSASRQRARGEQVRLSPIRERTGDRRSMLHVRVTSATRAALGPAPSVAAREILERATKTRPNRDS